MSLAQLATMVSRLEDDDLVIAIAAAPPAEDRAPAIGIAGAGFDGNLISDSTRTEGYVLSTDVAPTILARFGIATPDEMSGEPIRAEGKVDVASIESLGDRMAVISARRGPVIGVSLLVWIAVFGLAALVGSARVERVAVRLLALCVILLPLLLLAGAALEPSQESEQILVMFGAPALAAPALVVLGGYRALTVASAVVVLAYAVDVVAGSPLTSLSLLGPNPGLGVRFYGIGNELEALLAVLTIAGAGAGLTAFGPRRGRAAAVAFLAIAVATAAIFAAGRFGADVGAAIVLPVGGAAAAWAAAGGWRRGGLLVLVAPLAVLALIALGDLVSGANAHLTRSVLDAGGLDDLGEVAQRRLQLSAHSFARPIVLFFLPVVAALAALAFAGRDRLAAWLRPVPALRAGLIGALVATVVGTLANDSGALLLEIGAAYLLVFAAYAWSERSA